MQRAFHNLCLILAFLFLGTFMLGAARDIRQAQKDIQHPDVLLYQSPSILNQTDNNCASLADDRADQVVACVTFNESALYVAKDWTITKTVVFQTIGNDVGNACQIRFVEAGTAIALAGSPSIDFDSNSTGVPGVTTDTSAAWTIDEGYLLGVLVDHDDAKAACTGTLDPKFHIILYGKVTN